MQEKYVNPFTDFGFKKLFGEEASKDLLIDFLNQLLPQRHQIKSLTYTRNEQLGSTDLDRKAIFDLYCESQSGDKFIVELQKAKQNFFKDRSLFYATFPIREQAQRGDWDFELKAVYTIGILDFVFDEHKHTQKYMHRVQLMEVESKEVFYDKLTFIYLEMPKFNKEEAQLQTQFDKWLYFIRHLSQLDQIPKALQQKIFERAFALAEIARFSPDELQKYESSLKYYRDLKNVIDTSFEEGLEEGAEKTKKAIALEMIEEGISLQTIAKITKLSIEEVKKLQARK